LRPKAAIGSIGCRFGCKGPYPDPGPIVYTSKYLLDYARDSWTASACFPLSFRLVSHQTLNYKNLPTDEVISCLT
jgi:hypothetical protein